MSYLGPGLGVEGAVWHEGDQTEASEGYTLHPFEAPYLVFATKASGLPSRAVTVSCSKSTEHGQSIDYRSLLITQAPMPLRPCSRYSFSVAW